MSGWLNDMPSAICDVWNCGRCATQTFRWYSEDDDLWVEPSYCDQHAEQWDNENQCWLGSPPGLPALREGVADLALAREERQRRRGGA